MIKKYVNFFMVFGIASIILVAFGIGSGEVSSIALASEATNIANLAAKLGISLSSAGVVINLVSGGATVWTIISLVFGVTGAGLALAGGIAGIKYAIKHQGKDAAAAW